MSRSDAHDARNQAIRSSYGDLPALKAASPVTNEVVASESQRLDIPLKVKDVPEGQGAKIHWLGDSSLKDVMLYFHGGGFGMSAFPGHVTFLIQTQQKLAEQSKPYVIAFVQYSFTPEYKFPTQHMQAVQALKHILQSGRQPSNVIVGGDSAGGNLALGVLSAAAHSHSGIPALKLASPLKGALLISPWTSFSADSKSYTDNVDKDIVTKDIMVTLRDDFVAPGTKDEFAAPSLAESSWWKGIPVKSILNLGGGYEIFLNYIKELGAKMKEAGLNVETVECPMQVHIGCILDAQAGLEPGPMTLAIWEWLAKVL